MIEITEEERSSLEDGRAIHVRENGREYVLLRREVYDRIAENEYDDGPWDAEEMDRLREESVAMLDSYGMGT